MIASMYESFIKWVSSLDVETRHSFKLVVFLAVAVLSTSVFPANWVLTVFVSALFLTFLVSLCWFAFHVTGNVNKKFWRIYLLLYAVTGNERYKTLSGV